MTMTATMELKSGDCRCDKCASACRLLPGRMTPEEAQRAIAAGLASRMMLDWYDPCSRLGNNDKVLMITPGSVGYEGTDAPDTEDLFPGGLMQAWTSGPEPMPCTFFKDGLCGIHDSGFKPQQCRTVYACTGQGDENIVLARLWWTPLGQEVVEQWKRAAGYER